MKQQEWTRAQRFKKPTPHTPPINNGQQQFVEQLQSSPRIPPPPSQQLPQLTTPSARFSLKDELMESSLSSAGGADRFEGMSFFPRQLIGGSDRVISAISAIDESPPFLSQSQSSQMQNNSLKSQMPTPLTKSNSIQDKQNKSAYSSNQNNNNNSNLNSSQQQQQQLPGLVKSSQSNGGSSSAGGSVAATSSTTEEVPRKRTSGYVGKFMQHIHNSKFSSDVPVLTNGGEQSPGSTVASALAAAAVASSNQSLDASLNGGNPTGSAFDSDSSGRIFSKDVSGRQTNQSSQQPSEFFNRIGMGFAGENDDDDNDDFEEDNMLKQLEELSLGLKKSSSLFRGTTTTTTPITATTNDGNAGAVGGGGCSGNVGTTLNCNGSLQNNSKLVTSSQSATITASTTGNEQQVISRRRSSVNQDDKQSQEQETITKWKQGDFIGAGSFGQVFTAMNCNTGEIFVVKKIMIHSKPMLGKEYLDEQEKEMRIMQTLKHKHILQYKGHERLADSLCIFLEFMSEGNIDEMLKKFGPLEEQTIRIYARQALLGVEYLHSKKVVHKDIKGANMLISSDGVVKLSDFGCAKQLELTLNSMKEMNKTLKGSVPWMSPEIVTQTKYDTQADIWSFGCTILEMASALPPWSNYSFDNPIAAIMKIGLSAEIPHIPDTLSPPLDAFIRRCLKRNPADRPTASELLSDPFFAQIGV